MRAISVFEHGTISESLLDWEKTLLAGLRGPKGEKMFEVGWRETRATSFVGVVQLGTRMVQVLPKMYRLNVAAAECERAATANLLFLLSYTGRLRITEPEILRLTETSAPLSEILYWIFARRLWDAVRRELLRGYVSVETQLNVMKGRWRVARQMQSSDGWRRDRFDVAYDEFTEDNLPNRLFSATVIRVSRWAAWPDTRSLLARLRTAFADVADVAPQLKDFSDAARWIQKYRRRAGDGRLYRPLLEMARMFWEGAGPQPSPSHLDTFAFMFDMNTLFEEFISEFIRRELRSEWQSYDWSFQSQRGTRHLLCNESGRDLFKLVPDIRFETDHRETALVVDTKYKLLDPADRKLGVAEADAYQMFAYKERYRCPRVLLLYPQNSESVAHDFSSTADSPPWLEVRTVDLRRDLMRRRMDLREELSQILLPNKIEPES